MTIKRIQARFTSGNACEVTKALVPLAEWQDALKEILVRLELGGPEWERDNMIKALRAALEHSEPAPLKDHEIARLVNRLRDIAVVFHATEQLRAHIANEIVPLFRATALPRKAVKLSEEDISLALNSTIGIGYRHIDEFARAIEAAFIAKNNLGHLMDEGGN